MTDQDINSTNRLLNTPLEVGLRMLIILTETQGACDLQRLTIYDYMLLHSGDIDGGPESLHPPSPFRSGELLVKRSLIEKGLEILCSKGLVERSFCSGGIEFMATELAKPFLDYFESYYSKKARLTAGWIGSRFDGLDDNALQEFVNSRIGRWGTEFIGETLVEEEAF
jgi:hypothetical protein